MNILGEADSKIRWYLEHRAWPGDWTLLLVTQESSRSEFKHVEGAVARSYDHSDARAIGASIFTREDSAAMLAATQAMQVSATDRLAAVHSYDGLQASLPALERIAELGARLMGVPICIISLLNDQRQRVLAKTGTDFTGTSVGLSFCVHAICQQDVLVVLDARRDGRFAINPAVVGEPFTRFYAGTPLKTADSLNIGTLCVIDTHPRAAFSISEQRNLQDLAALVVDQMQLTRLSMEREVQEARFAQIAATSPDAIICTDASGVIQSWNDSATTLFGYRPDEAIGSGLGIITPARFMAAHQRGMERVIAGGPVHLVGQTIELEAIRSDGSEFPIELSLSMWGSGPSSSFGAIIRDITERRSHEAELVRRARIDPLTGLGNRLCFNEAIAGRVDAKAWTAVLLLDLDGFKEVNDRFGHMTGDGVLQMVAERLRQACEDKALCCRLGGDEFAIIMEQQGDFEEILVFATRLITHAKEPYVYLEECATLSASVGIAIYPEHGANSRALLTAADMAMYRAKTEARGGAVLFSETLKAIEHARIELRDAVTLAVQRQELALFYQPEIDLDEKWVVGCEALLRWNRPGIGLMTPDAFLSSLIETQQSSVVGDWILDEACRQAVLFRAQSESEFKMAVNLFESQLRDPELAQKVFAALDRHHLPAESLEIEITENIMLSPGGHAVDALHQLRQAGVSIAFDDYGTGFASLQLLKSVPVSKLKIDRSFVTDLCESKVDRALVRSIDYLARSFKLDLVAEGIETERQLQILLAMGCRYGQGFLFGKPVPPDEFKTELFC